MKTTIFTLIALLTCAFSFSQTVVTPEWVRNYSDRDSMTNIPSAIDVNGNIYVTGSVRTLNQGYNFATIKYNQQGDTLWVKTYNGTAMLDDEAVAITLDANGNIIVTGKSKNSNNNYDIVTIKYSTSGAVVFEKRYNGSVNGNDIPADVTTDNTGNVYTTGYSRQTINYDYYITIKYTSTGTQSYIKTFNSTASGNCRATSVLWKNNRLFVCGFAYQNTGIYSVTTQSYIASNGVTLWTTNYGVVSAIPPTPAKIAYFANNIYVSGTVGTNPNFDYSLIKYTANNGAQQWATTYNAYGFNDFSTSMVTDNSGNIFVTGKAYNSNNLYEYHTLKYSSSGGLSWTNKYTTNLSDNAAVGTVINKIAVDPYNMLYVCGSVKAGNTSDMLLYQLTASGNMVWDETYNGQANGDDAATDMVIDAQGQIFLTGQTQNGVSKFDYTTVKLSQTFVYNPIDLYNEPRQSSFDYIKNKGQLVNTNNALIPEIKYYVPNTYPALFFTPKRLSFVFAKIDTVQTTLDTLHRIDMTFANCNSLATIFPIDTTAGYTNYFLAQCPQGITNVKGNERLFVPSIYPNIDLHYYSNNAGLKMYFVLKPGANPKDIAMLFNGQNNLQVNSNGELEITSSIGNTKLEQPHAYMVNFGQQIIPVNWQPTWQLQSSNKATITTGTWNGPFPLVLMVDEGHLQQQQNLNGSEWSTYFGNQSDVGTFSMSRVNDSKFYSGSLYVTGTVYGSNFPVVLGFQTSSNGSWDAFISKFDGSYNLTYSTYLGGDYEDEANSIDVNNNNILVTGVCQGHNFPVWPSTNPNDGTYWQNNPNDDIMGFIAKLNSSGNPIRINSFGGPLTTKILSGKLDNSSNIYITGHTNVTNAAECINGNPPVNAFPLQQYGTAYYQNTRQGTDDAFIAKFSNNNIILWSTLLGGSGNEYGKDIALNGNNIYIVGVTNSEPDPDLCSNSDNGFPICTGTGYFQNYSAGGTDGFISKFDLTGNILLSSYIGGLSNDCLNDIAFNSDGDCYILGVTLSESDANYSINTPPASHKLRIYDPNNTAKREINNNSASGATDMFLYRLNQNDELIWSTFIGGSSYEVGYDIGYYLLDISCDLYIDNYKNIFIIGATNSSDCDLENLNGSINQPYNALFDAYLVGYNSNNVFGYGTYIGGTSDDYPYCITGTTQKLYFGGETYSTDYPTQQYLLNPSSFFSNDMTPGYSDGFITNVKYTNTIDVPENLLSNNFQIFPNPCSSKLNVVLSEDNNNNWNVKIIDISGRIIIEKYFKENKFSLNIEKLDRGSYLIECFGKNQRFSKPIIVFR